MKNKLLFAWLILPVLMFSQTWADQNSGITNNLFSVRFIDDNNGWSVGRQGKIVRTTNAGASWSQQNSGTTNDLNKVFMVNANTGYAVGDNGVCIKYNGTSWSTLTTNTSVNMHGVFFLNASTGWISGDLGRIMMTTNGGTSWITQVGASNYVNLFYDVYMISANEGWAVGSSGRVLKYNGTNWNNVTTPATEDLFSVNFNNSINGFMTGKSSKVFRFSGSSWIAENTALPTNDYGINSVFTVNNNLAYAATSPGFGGGGIILKYDGSFWNKDYEFTGMGSEFFDGITVTAGGIGFVVGASGLIKSVNTGVASLNDRNYNVNKISAYPNPFTNETLIRFVTTANDEYELEVADVSGKVVVKEDKKWFNAGDNTIQINGNALNNGFYIYTLKSNNGNISGKLIKE